jgi:hypothetical protein
MLQIHDMIPLKNGSAAQNPFRKQYDHAPLSFDQKMSLSSGNAKILPFASCEPFFSGYAAIPIFMTP